MGKLLELAARLEGGEESLELDVLCAEALDWRQRRVTGLGLNGRTPGSDLWFPPFAPWGTKGSRRPPHFSGPRKRKWAAAALRAKEQNHG